MTPHVHIDAIHAIITLLYVIIALGCIHIIARRFEGNAMADSVLNYLV